MRRRFVALVAVLVAACTAPPSEHVIDAVIKGDAETAARTAIQEELARQGVPTDIEGLPELIDGFLALLRDKWGEPEPEVASEHRYVKYSGDYEARAIVDFDEGWVQVETIAVDAPLEKLRKAIVSTLLTTRDMRAEDIFSDNEPPTGGEPFLYKQILDADGQPIRWPWRAERYADHLVQSSVTVRREHDRTIRSIRTSLVANHLKLRELEYSNYVLASAREYGVAPEMIYAVIEVESAFNPYAVSPAKAYGLMQVVPTTAGRDVYQRIKKLGGEPTREQLFKPGFNIDIGSAYLHLLDDTYLARIRDKQSRHFAAIASYNGGAGSTLKAFDVNRDRAVTAINKLSSQQVYDHIVRKHPFAETRRYLEKVASAEKKYR